MDNSTSRDGMAWGKAPWMRRVAEALARTLPNGTFRLRDRQGKHGLLTSRRNSP
jgi:hypothetical protein